MLINHFILNFLVTGKRNDRLFSLTIFFEKARKEKRFYPLFLVDFC